MWRIRPREALPHLIALSAPLTAPEAKQNSAVKVTEFM